RIRARTRGLAGPPPGSLSEGGGADLGLGGARRFGRRAMAGARVGRYGDSPSVVSSRAMDREPFLLVVNPRAGAGEASRRLPALRRALEDAGARFDVATTQGPRDATRIVREALRGGAAGIAVVGGDGTLSEAVNGFFDDGG